MRCCARLLVAVAAGHLSLACALAGEQTAYIDLEPYANRKLSDNQGRGYDGNSLDCLQSGEQILGGMKFNIGPGLVQLGSRILSALPDHVEGIKVKERFSKLNILHATCFGGGPNEEGSEGYVKDGTAIGHYLVHYDDQTTERIPIVYGEDVRDWFFIEGEKEPSRATVVWTGSNDFATSAGSRLRLYATTWKNPKPDKRVMRIDFVSRKNDTPCAPLCLAMTAVKE